MEESSATIFKGLELSKEDIKFLSKYWKREVFKKGSLIFDSEKKVVDQYYVLKGCLRAFFIDEEGKEHTIQFAVADWWITDYMSYFLDEKSVLTIEVIEDSILLRISKDDFEKVFDKIPVIERFIRKKLERFMAKSQKRTLLNLSQSAKERYINFTNVYPEIEQHVKNHHIASYLGIATQSLSRIRKEISNNS
jgi:CRP-like cAMP-binding protein